MGQLNIMLSEDLDFTVKWKIQVMKRKKLPKLFQLHHTKDCRGRSGERRPTPKWGQLTPPPNSTSEIKYRNTIIFA